MNVFVHWGTFLGKCQFSLVRTLRIDLPGMQVMYPKIRWEWHHLVRRYF